jgi:hypothetical protein
MSLAILSLEQAREELREGKQIYDAIIERRINALSQTFEQRTGWVIVEQDLEDHRVSGNGKTSMCLPIVPVQEITKIELRNPSDDSVYKTITDTTKFLLKSIDRFDRSLDGYVQLFDGETFLCGHLNVLIDAKVGFPKDDPKRAEAERLLIMQLAFEYKRWTNNEAGVLSRTMGDGSVSFAPPQNLLKEVEDGLLDLGAERIPIIG